MGLFMILSPDPSVQLIGVEAAGRGIDTAETAATISCGRPGIFHGMESYFLQDDDGQIAPVYSISAGLDYPGIGPEHAHLYDTGRARMLLLQTMKRLLPLNTCPAWRASSQLLKVPMPWPTL